MHNQVKKSFQWILVFLAMLAMSLSVLYTPAYAQDGGGGEVTEQGKGTFGLRPSDTSRGFFVFKGLKPGDTFSDSLYMINQYDEDLSFVLTVTDATTAQTGGIAFPETEAVGTGKWVVDIGVKGEIVVPAKQAIQVPFVVEVPKDAQPGEYVLGFVMTPTAESLSKMQGWGNQEVSSGFVVKVLPRVGVTAVLFVSEPNRCEIHIDSLERNNYFGKMLIKINMTNTGNVHFRGSGNLRIVKADDNSVVNDLNFNMGYWVMQTSVGYPIMLENFLPTGKYLAEVTLTSSEVDGCTAKYQETFEITSEEKSAADKDATVWNPEEKQEGFLITPQMMQMAAFICGGILLLLLLILLLVFLKRRRQKQQNQAE